MAARTTGWAQRRLAGTAAPTVPVATLNAILGTGTDPKLNTLASAQSFEVTAGVSVSIRWGCSAVPGSGAASSYAVYLAIFYETSQTLYDGGTDTVSIVNTSGSAPVNVSCHDHLSGTGAATTVDRTLTFTPTHTGTVRLFVRQAVWTTATNTISNDFNTDSANFGSHAETIVALDVSLDFTPGLVRAGTTLTSLTVGGVGSPAAFSDTAALVTIVTGAAPAIADGTYTLLYRSAVPTTFLTQTLAAGTSTSVASATHGVDNVYPIASTAVRLELTPDNSGLSTALSGAGLPWIHFTTAPSTPGTVTTTTDAAGNIVGLVFAGAYTADPRLTIQPYMQLNVLTVNSPPDGVTDSTFNRTSRLTSEIGEWTFRVKDARGVGINSITFTAASVTLTDAGGVGTPNVRAGNTLQSSTLGGALGWLVGSGGLGGADPNFAGWSDQLPSGNWKLNYTISGPSNATGLGTPASGTNAFVLLAPNPNLHAVVEAGSSRIAGHMSVGDTLGVVFSIYDSVANQLVALDAGPTVSLTRTTNSRTQYLGADLDWHDLTGAAVADVFTMTETVVGVSRLYSASFASAATKWTNRDIKIVAVGKVNGTPYVDAISVEVVANYNSHNRDVQVVCGAGNAGAALSNHWNVGDDLLIGMTLYSPAQLTLVSPDTSPVPGFSLFRLNQATGRGQALKADYTWENIPVASELFATTASGTQVLTAATTSLTVVSTAGAPASGSILVLYQGGEFAILPYTSVDATHFLGITGGNGVITTASAVTQNYSAHAFAGTVDPADSRIYTYTFTAAQASVANGWDDSDLFVVADMFLNLRRYLSPRQLIVVGTPNAHDGYALDALQLAVSGKLGLK